MLNALRRNSAKTRLVRSLYAALVKQSRQPTFFIELGVADTIDGRFDLLALHTWLIFKRLRSSGNADIAHALSDAIFVGFDEGLRDLGAGDMGLGRKIRQMGEAFNGRVQAYESASSESDLAAAILRNVYRGDERHSQNARVMARYARDAQTRLEACDPLSGSIEFGSLPKYLS